MPGKLTCMCACVCMCSDAIMHISDAMQHVVRRAEELRRLEAAREYLTTLHRAMVVSERAKGAIMVRYPCLTCLP